MLRALLARPALRLLPSTLRPFLTMPAFGSAKYITPADLAEVIKQVPLTDQKSPVAVVDVRDDDFYGGNIPGCRQLPARSTSEQDYTSLVAELADKDKVVFHCTMSQVRGPKAAARYASALAELKPDSTQDVLILHEGFASWQAKYRKDPELVEKFVKAAWD